jgi:polyhydroxybutyrate depolymerase
MIHGMADEEFPPEGRRGVIVSAVSIDATVAHWVATDGCETTPVSSDLADLAADGTTVSRHVYGDCDGGAEVAFYRVDGGGHTWPGSSVVFSPALGAASQDFDASDTMAEFLLRFAL